MIQLISRRQLLDYGILGINGRNRDYVAAYNERKYFPLVDNKLTTKQLAHKHGIATPQLRFVLRGQPAIKQVSPLLAKRESFVIKPAKGSGGKGILVITKRKGEQFFKASGEALDRQDLERHMSNVLAGLYSLAGTPDHILIEDVVICHESLRRYSYEGVPDIRIIVFKGYPVMAMLRLATRASDGKANLHQGAVGVGLDLGTGRALQAVQFSKRLTRHPDNGQDLHQIAIADWQNMLLLAASCFEMTHLGYMGVDLVVDQHAGAQLLELNARPGLAIQICNGEGLAPRLRHIQTLDWPRQSPAQRVAYAQEQFAKYRQTA